jgi:ABC-2 type transport system permease protein
MPSGFLTGGVAGPPNWVAFLFQLPPSNAYQNAIGGVFSGSGTDAFFLSGWFSLLVLVLWGCISLALGYIRYRRADL